MKKMIYCLALLVLVLWSQSISAQSENTDSRLDKIIERLYLNHKSLTVVYSNLHDSARNALDGSDQQLSYIQKTYLFVSEAKLICYCQWALLSINGYIKDSHRSDYYALRLKDLKRAIFESQDRLVSLELYSAYIESDAPRRLVEEAVGIIQANIYMFEELLDLLEPLANPSRPFDRDPRDS
jgi:hypothetical protein